VCPPWHCKDKFWKWAVRHGVCKIRQPCLAYPQTAPSIVLYRTFTPQGNSLISWQSYFTSPFISWTPKPSKALALASPSEYTLDSYFTE
jgi:hypothetical protein